jgi:DNA-binding GntR family transcriptional regulator
MPALTRESRVDRLTEALIAEVLSGRLAPGEHLREEEFAASFEVSRNTLREACHRLAQEGLLVHRPHRGIVVARPSPDGVREIFRIRRALETAGLTAADVDCARALVEIAGRMEAAAASADWAELVDLDLAFHARLVAALESLRLNEFFEVILRELRHSFVLIDSAGGDISSPTHVPDHRQIAVELSEGNVEGARSRLVEHLKAAEVLVLNYIEDESAAGVTAAAGR